METTLRVIAKELNQLAVLWGVGGSVLLHQYGLVETPGDIDLFVDLTEVNRIEQVLSCLGEKQVSPPHARYLTTCFREYVIGGVDVDVMAEFAIRHESGVYRFVFDKQSLVESRIVQGETIPFTSLEDWYVLYRLLPNGLEKATRIETYFHRHGIKQPTLLHRALMGCLPDKIKQDVQRLLQIK